MEELGKSVEELQNRLKSLEAQVQEIREMLPRTVVSEEKEASPPRTVIVEEREEPWEVVEIEKVMKKWYDAVKKEVIVSASRDEHGGWVNTSVVESLTKLPIDKVVFLLSPFSNEQRLKILLQLCEYPKSATDLTNATGLQGGQLYHHLEELMGARYIEKPYKGKYYLTDIGRWAFYNILHTAQHLGKSYRREKELESGST